VSDDEKKFLMGMVTVDRNTTPSSGCCFHATSGVTGLEAVCETGAHVSRATGQESIYWSW
jgi:hypothetical protein